MSKGNYTSANLGALDAVSGWFEPGYDADMIATISGTFVGTITPQLSTDLGDTPIDMDTTYTAGAAFNIIPAKGVLYRFKMTAWTSGTANVSMRG